ncbi:NPCBM/NEW2 domain-containing protein, partial [bacterium]|nr:NPCBM/NEW2 domain-containing protein [bacterium]
LFSSGMKDITQSNSEERGQSWQDEVLAVPYPEPTLKKAPILQLVHQELEELEFGQSVIKTPLIIGQRQFKHGLGTHSVSHIRVYSPEPIERFSAWIGVDNNERTKDGQGSVVFSVSAGDEELYRSGVLRGGQESERIDIDTKGVKIIDLHVGDGGDGLSCDHADWADATITTREGKTIQLDEIQLGVIPTLASRYPFSFVYGGKHSDDILDDWHRENYSEELDASQIKITTIWTEPNTGLRIRWEVTRFSDFPALEWLLYFENTGTVDTPIIQDIQALDMTFQSPISNNIPYRLHKTNGAPSNPTDFEVSTAVIDKRNPESMSGGGGRSSNKDFPFFKIETGGGSVIIAVGWSGQWQASVECPDGNQLHVTAGLEKTHFLLHPGEKVRSPRMLVLYWEGDTFESNAQFRQLIYKHYVAVRNGQKPLPTLYCNTCFTRGGHWLNECNAENQISLINAYGPLGLEALLTDAGWFEGGWPRGAGNWTPRKDAYPNGMGPVAAAAKSQGMIYGLWFEMERVVSGTWIHKHHPEWLLSSSDGPQNTYLLNLGLPEAREYMFGIVKGFMELPGFRVYRQDFNMDPLPYWLYSDAPERQGISEIKYIEGLYAYWDRIAETWPDSLRIECASGGRRIDLETVRRMHVHQKSDYWFDNEVDQASIWGLSQYLPNNVFMAPINRMDDYSFHSALATSLCMGWIADAPDFDFQRGKKFLDRYREIRHLLIGAWYPLLPYSRNFMDWIASQYHRPDLDEGVILVFRRPESPYRTTEVSLRGLDAKAMYELFYDSTGAKKRAQGSDLMGTFQVTIPQKHQSELIVYRKAED